MCKDDGLHIDSTRTERTAKTLRCIGRSCPVFDAGPRICMLPGASFALHSTCGLDDTALDPD
ncbi:hypothetical protein NUU61_003082 [Penicillium alfredii]|uniref:Uncharacterized protein n=1 Tax=Penicillium alfredii TaxID=1506179 RepID=A0A9W9KGL5_9EURO|nr:uncharacterized protein NUU61_003082 [Penicillium alfredii]KAJ5105735.1 hypothetical protein NUU61_003082 [Penicillium alfredii]